jgi:hypothetical protein
VPAGVAWTHAAAPVPFAKCCSQSWSALQQDSGSSRSRCRLRVAVGLCLSVCLPGKAVRASLVARDSYILGSSWAEPSFPKATTGPLSIPHCQESAIFGQSRLTPMGSFGCNPFVWLILI